MPLVHPLPEVNDTVWWKTSDGWRKFVVRRAETWGAILIKVTAFNKACELGVIIAGEGLHTYEISGGGIRWHQIQADEKVCPPPLFALLGED